MIEVSKLFTYFMTQNIYIQMRYIDGVMTEIFIQVYICLELLTTLTKYKKSFYLSSIKFREQFMLGTLNQNDNAILFCACRTFYVLTLTSGKETLVNTCYCNFRLTLLYFCFSNPSLGRKTSSICINSYSSRGVFRTLSNI